MNRIRVILIDDHKLLRNGLRGLLEKNNEIIVIGESETGKEGISKVINQKPDVAIVDIGLLDMSGVKVIEKIRQGALNTKVIALSSHDDPKDVIGALNAGANAYVLKDISDDDLIFVIKNVARDAIFIDAKVSEIFKNTIYKESPQKKLSRASFKEQHANLTEREYEVLKLVVDGKSNQQIADILSISEHTSKAHVCSIIQKLVVDDRTQAAVKAIKEGII